jgi:uncharacterized membrane protein
MRLPDLLPVVAGIASILYPFLVYFGLPHLAPAALVVLAVGIGGLQLHRRRGGGIMPRWSLLLIPCVMLALLAVRPVLAVQAYPPLISLCLAATFAWSLARPPTAIERIARLSNPDLPPAAIAYTRVVTKVWMMFFLANAAIATACALWFTVAIWTLWTGLVSYVLIGVLFIGELMVRRLVSPRAPAQVAPEAPPEATQRAIT